MQTWEALLKTNEPTEPSFLLTALREPILPCGNGDCVSGSPSCNNSLCGFLDSEGILHTTGIVVEKTRGGGEAEKEVADIGMLRIGACPNALLILAMGGGGNAAYCYTSGAGSGSINFTEVVASSSYAQYWAQVGAAGESSVVTDVLDGGIVVRAEAGE